MRWNASAGVVLMRKRPSYRARPREIGCRNVSNATNGRDQKRCLLFSMGAWEAAATHTASEMDKLATPSGQRKWNGTESTRSGNVTVIWNSRDVASMRANAGGGE